MAYSAVISLLQILDELRDPDQLENIPYPKIEVYRLQERLSFLKEFLEMNPSGGDLEVKIREAMYKAEDVFDSYLSNFGLSSETSGEIYTSFSLALKEVLTEVDFIAETAEEIIRPAEPPSLPTSSIQELSRRNLIAGREADLTRLINRVKAGSEALETIPIWGISRVGKTHLARIVYEDWDIVSRFRLRAWVEVSVGYSRKEILLGLLRSMGKLDSGEGQESAEDELAKTLSRILRSGNYLIVLDDVCSLEAWDNLKELFPDYDNRSRVMLTTRLKEVAEYANGGGVSEEIRPLSEEESWSLLQSLAFRHKSCPEELEETAMRVSANCDGFPLALVTVGGALMEAGEKDWEIAASSLSDCGDYDELIDAVVVLSYNSLRQYVKECLLYMGIFPINYEIPVSKLLQLWIDEGFIEQIGQSESLEEMVERCLSQLVERGIVLASEQSCRIGGVYHEFLNKKAEEEKFFHFLPTSLIQELNPRNLYLEREDDFIHLTDRLMAGSLALDTVPIFGISGIGKSRLADVVLKDGEIMSRFTIRAWVKVSQEYSKKEVLLSLLRSMTKLASGKGQESTEDELARRLFKFLKSNVYLIVLDDVCNTEAWDDLKGLFPDCNNGSRIILTTRRKEVAESAGQPIPEICPLSEKESLSLLHKVVFHHKSCPKELRETARLVSANCKGLPLAIVTVGGVLMEAGAKDWEIAASSLSDCGDCDELIDAVMLLSYKSLPQHAKACLLYMGIFPNNYEIPASKLLQLWIAEGFIEKNDQFESLEKMAEKCLRQLVERGIIVVSEQSPIGKIRTCRTDGVYHEFLKKKAEEENFSHVVNGYRSCFPDETWTQGRFCILNNIHFANKDELRSKRSVPNVRSLLFGGAQEQYPLWVHLDFKLLRVLDALKIQFYSFPYEIFKLVHLRYLALTYNGEIPESICGLWNLQFLIVLRHLSSKVSKDVSRLPLEIWNMNELRHLQLMGRDLPDSSTTPHLENLVTLLDVSSHSCTPGILEKVPNLKKLGVRIESPALDAAEDFSFLSHLVILEHLESFKCVVVHPDFAYQVSSSIPCFPPTLTKLSLSGCGFSWDKMKVIAKLPKLESLKLRWYAFRGSEWKQEGDGHEHKDFAQLRFLLLEDLNIVLWKASSSHFPLLTNLVIRHCYKLQVIPSGSGSFPALKKIELVDCNSAAAKSAQKVKQDQLSKGFIQVDVHSSRDD